MTVVEWLFYFQTFNLLIDEIEDSGILRLQGSPTEIACIVYNNGYPPKPHLTLTDMRKSGMVLKSTDPQVEDDFFCLEGKLWTPRRQI